MYDHRRHGLSPLGGVFYELSVIPADDRDTIRILLYQILVDVRSHPQPQHRRYPSHRRYVVLQVSRTYTVIVIVQAKWTATSVCQSVPDTLWSGMRHPMRGCPPALPVIFLRDSR